MNTLREQALREYLENANCFRKYTCFARGGDMVLKNYGSSVLTVQSSRVATNALNVRNNNNNNNNSLGSILRTIISVATLPELSSTAIHESA